jgi:mannose/fructose/N-acetylgalactosamine-specific phosphotransferase system component IID
MIGKYDLVVDDVAGWFAENRKEITPQDIVPILRRHFDTEEDLNREVDRFLQFLQTPKGRESWRIALRSHIESKPVNLIE